MCVCVCVCMYVRVVGTFLCVCVMKTRFPNVRMSTKRTQMYTVYICVLDWN